MTQWTAIFGIVAIACITGAVSRYFRARVRMTGSRDLEALESRLAESERANRALEDRIKTLERIVTDGRYDLKREFESLGR